MDNDIRVTNIATSAGNPYETIIILKDYFDNLINQLQCPDRWGKVTRVKIPDAGIIAFNNNIHTYVGFIRFEKSQLHLMLVTY